MYTNSFYYGKQKTIYFLFYFHQIVHQEDFTFFFLSENGEKKMINYQGIEIETIYNVK
jgi:hypothetical protein